MPHWSRYRGPAPAAAHGPRTRRIADPADLTLACGALPLLFAAAPTPVAAQVGASLTAASDFRVRGASLSQGKPAATLSVAGDARSGLFADASATAAILPHARLRLVGASGNLGFARRLGSDLSADVGVTRVEFTAAALGDHRAGYTEAYIGLHRNAATLRLHYSPGYFSGGVRTLYIDSALALRLSDRTSVALHGGVLTYVGGQSYPVRFDAQVAVRRRFGRWQAQLAAITGGPGRAYYAQDASRSALVASVAFAF